MGKKVHIVTSKSGDWVDIVVDGHKVFGDHTFDWEDLLYLLPTHFDCEVTHQEMADEVMKEHELFGTPDSGPVDNQPPGAVIYTDGACKGNPGPGGWAAIILYKGTRTELSGGFRKTTNNRMELMACIAGLEHLDYACEVTLYTDSQYISNAFNKKWIYGWQKANWRRGEEPIPNADLWKRMWHLTQLHKVRFIWVKGHANNTLNEQCDKLSVAKANSTGLPADECYERLKK